MALVIKDRVKETTTTTGTGTLTLAGAASGFQAFSAIGDGNTTYYAITDQATGDWEVGIGTYTASGTTLSRDTILASSNAGSAVNLSAGIKNAFATYPAGKAAFFDDIPTNNNQLTNGAGYITGNQTITLSGDVSGSGTTSIAVTVADDSHNHVISNVDGLQTALDAKQAAATALTTSTTFGGDVSGTYNSIAVTNDSHSHTGSTLSGIAVSNLDGAAVQTSAEAFADVDTALMTAAAIEDRITGKGYLTGNQTITLSGDASGSGTTSIAVTVANDSHTHDTRYYTETEIGNFFSGTTAITGYSKSNWDTAYGWGNHASAGYLTGNQTITLSGDATGSGTTSITVTVADDSHNHIISNVDGLQTALDGKQPLDADLTAIGALAKTDGNFIVGNGTTWVAESGATARTSLGLGALATLSSVNAATITDNSVGAAELNVSGNGTTSQFLRSDGDGTFTWATPTDTNTTYSAGTGLTLSTTTFSVNYGTTAGTACQGNDSRLSNSRTCNNTFDSAATARTNLGLGSLATLSTVNAATITDNSVGAAELNVSGNGTTSQYLRSDGDGTFTWATPTDTNTTYSAGAGLDLTGTSFSVESDLRGEVFYIGRDTNDYIGVETTQINFVLDGNTDARLYNNGDFHADGNVIAYSTSISDARLKKDVSVVENALEKVNKLRGVEFTYTYEDKRSAGVIAQELEDVLPQAVSETHLELKTGSKDDKYKVVQYDQLHALLIEAIKELTDRVEKLESQAG